jgi:hypothetical protein
VLSRFVPQTSAGRVAFATAIAVGLVAGGLAGRSTAYYQSIGGMSAAFGPVSLVFVAFGLGLVAVVALLVARLRGVLPTARRAVVPGALAYLIGATVGVATAAATGGTYTPPLIETLGGTANATIERAPTSFEPRPDGSASCQTGPDTEVLESITAENLGELGSGTLRATLWFEIDGGPRLDLAIDDADLAEPGTVVWLGPVVLSNVAADRSTGLATFSELALNVDSKLPPAPNLYAGPLSGTFTWTCEPRP